MDIGLYSIPFHMDSNPVVGRVEESSYLSVRYSQIHHTTVGTVSGGKP